MINLNENENYLKSYDKVSEEIKYVANSIIRLKILASLFEKPSNMKDLAKNTKLNYSSISTTLQGLELKNFVYRESNKYYLSNSLIILMKNVLEVKEVVNLLNRIFNIVQGHVVDVLPITSIVELYLLGNASLMESDAVDAYKINNFIEDALSDAKRVHCILPFYHLGFKERIDDLVKSNNHVEVFVSDEVFEIFEENSEIKYLYSFNQKNNFLLIVTDKMMILGLFRDDGYFDQNRLLTSKNKDAVKWANNLYKTFKKKNK